MSFIKKNKLLLALLIVFLCYGIYHEAISIKVSNTGYYKGTVIDKTISAGRMSTHYLLADWDRVGRSSIVVHPLTYKRTGVGDRISIQYKYTPFLGASGTAYMPKDKEYSLVFGAAGFMSKIASIIVIVVLWRRNTKKSNDEDK